MLENESEIKLCVDCINCKKKKKKIYCKFGVWEIEDIGRSILYTPFDFDCYYWESV
jgi:hypothetical protein